MIPLGKRIRRIRLLSDYSIEEIERRSDGQIKGHWLRRVENGGIASPGMKKLEILASILKVSMQELLEDESAKEDEPVQIEEELILRYRLRPGTKLTNEAKREAERIMKAVIEGLADENKKAGWGGDAAGQ